MYMHIASRLSPSSPPPSNNLPYLALIIVGVVLVGVSVATGVCLWRNRKSRGIGWNGYGKLCYLFSHVLMYSIHM